jgi:hypothetical protein
LSDVCKLSIDDEDFTLNDIQLSGGRIIPPSTFRDLITVELETVEPLKVACGSMHTVKVLVDAFIHWQFPKERFVTYERSDIEWCRYFGIGEEKLSKVLFVMPDAYCTAISPNTVTFVSTYQRFRVDGNRLTELELL